MFLRFFELFNPQKYHKSGTEKYFERIKGTYIFSAYISRSTGVQSSLRPVGLMYLS
jgi:hypothetical protein